MNIDIQTLIPLFVAIPLATSLLIQLVARGRRILSESLTILSMLLLVVMACFTIGRTRDPAPGGSLRARREAISR